MDRIDAMAAFVAVAEAGSLVGAAAALGRSPSAVTRAIAALEARVGRPLLQRSTRRLRLTEAGQRYLPLCRRLLADLAAADDAVTEGTGAARGQLTLAAPTGIGTRLLRPVLDGLLDQHPDLQARLLLVDRPTALVEEGLDAALRLEATPEAGVTLLRLGAIRRVTCASPGYLARSGTPRQPEDLARHTCIAGPLTPDARWRYAAGPGPNRPRSVAARTRLMISTVEAALDSARDGHGIVCAPSDAIAADLREGRLVRLLEPFEPPATPIMLAHPTALSALPRLRAFLDHALPRLRAALAEALPAKPPLPA